MSLKKGQNSKNDEGKSKHIIKETKKEGKKKIHKTDGDYMQSVGCTNNKLRAYLCSGFAGAHYRAGSAGAHYRA